MPHRLKTNQRHGKTQEQNGTDVAFTGDLEQGGDDAPLALHDALCCIYGKRFSTGLDKYSKHDLTLH